MLGPTPKQSCWPTYRPVSYSAGLQYRLYIGQAYLPTGQLAIQQAAGGLIVPGLASPARRRSVLRTAYIPYPAHLNNIFNRANSPGIQAVEARHHLYTTNLQNTQPGWSRRSTGDAPTERTSRASPSSASLGVLRLVEVGATTIKGGCDVPLASLCRGLISRSRLFTYRLACYLIR